jgi:nucleolar protein 9
MQLVPRYSTDFFTLCKSLFGSRVAEFALGCVMTRVGRAPPEALLEALQAPLQAMSDSISAAAVDSAYDPRVSPVARKVGRCTQAESC